MFVTAISTLKIFAVKMNNNVGIASIVWELQL
jgi:hypothetical protein